MKIGICIHAILLYCFIFVTQAAVPNGDNGKDDITCRVVLIHVLHGSNEIADKGHSRYECDKISEDGHVEDSFAVDLPLDLVEANKEALQAGEWYLRISKSAIGETQLEGYGSLATHIRLSTLTKLTTVPPTEGLAGLHTRGRRLSLTSGTRTVIILRVKVNDAEPQYSATQLVQSFFNPNNYSVASHFKQCSSGALTFESYNASNPVSDIYVNTSIKSITKEQLYLAATKSAIAKFGIHPNRMANHVAIVLPAGTKDKYWFGFGGVKDWRVVFNNTIGGIVNTVMHELGHNVGLQHTGRNGDQYADLSSIMGYGKFRQFGPPKCFSGLNFWYLGWFANRQVEIIPTNQTQVVQLATFVDYVNTTSWQSVVVKVGGYHMVYNRAKGFNRGTEIAQDQVTVVFGKPQSPSTLVAMLGNTDATSTFVAPNYNGTSQNLTITVCQIANGGPADYATLSISLGKPVCTVNRLRGKRR